jgi:fatty-acyl-CoA synthase
MPFALATGEQPLRSRRLIWTNQLQRHTEMQPNEVACRFDGHGRTWAELYRRTAALATALHGLGVTRGERVVIGVTNRIEFIEAVLAANYLGAIAVPLNFRLTAPEVTDLVRQCRPRVIVTESALVHLFDRAVEIASPPLPLIAVGAQFGSGTIRYEDLLSEVVPVVEMDDTPEDSPALIMYTSGTTGRPKGAVLTHLNLVSQVMTTLTTHGVDLADDTWFVGVPLFHIAGIGNIVAAVMLGVPTVLYPSGAFDAAQLLDVLEGEHITVLFLVPAQWRMVCAVQRARPRKLVLRAILWGAAPASESLLREIQAVFPGVALHAAFGQTEMSPVTCYLDSSQALRKLGSVGTLVPAVRARVVDDDMRDVEPGAVGEIVYQGTQLMAGFWEDPTATAEAFRGGWFHSGDLVRRDEDGYYWVVDRKKDMIISGGENVYCAEVENALAAHPAIVEVAVVGSPDEHWGEVPVAFVAVTENVDVAALHDFLETRLARYKHPKSIEIIDELPRNASGKVDKPDLRSRFVQ